MKNSIALPKIRIVQDSTSSNGHNVFPLAEFKALVKYERTRSDRNGSVFSVAVFTSDSKGISQKDMVYKISQLSRSIDCVGLGDKGQVSVLLPDTKRQGAEIFGNKVLVELAKIVNKPIGFEVYSYPENWLYSNKDREPSNPGESKGYESIRDSVELLFVEAIPAWKRALDIVGASLLIILASPILLAVSAFIKLVSPGPVFFKQTRIGYKGIPFDFWKFRTMKPDNDQAFHGAHAHNFIASGDVPMMKLDTIDPRIIFGGRVLRKSCLDELPQLWNVLKGDMSLVGPRPCIPYEAKEYLRWHTHRFDVLPGMSGLWQVSGKNKLTFKQMVRLDITYCQNQSFLGDLAIIARTPIAILKMCLEAGVNKLCSDAGTPMPSVSMPLRSPSKEALQ